jgi:hypothetical protein
MSSSGSDKEIYCNVFDWRPTLLGNRSRNSSMDTLITPVLLRYMVTNSSTASVSIVAGSVKEGKTIHAIQSAPVRESSSVSRRSQKCSALEVRRQCSTVPSVGYKEPPVLSVHGNCNLCNCKSP